MNARLFNIKDGWLWVIIALLSFIPEFIFAQGCCCGGGGAMGTSIARFGLEVSGPQNLNLLMGYDLNNMNSLYDGNVRLESNDNQRVIHTGLLVANYGISRKWSVAGIGSYIGQELATLDLDGRRQVDYVYGIGDFIFMVKYRITNPLAYNGWGLYVGAGVKLPTGSTSKTSSEGAVLPADIQPGTGSLDGIGWLSLSKSHIFITNLYFNTGATYRLSGQNKDFKDSLLYSPGDEFQFTAGLNYNFFAGIVFDVFNYVQYRYQSVNELSGEPVDKTGGHWLVTSPGLRLNFTQNFALILTTDIPLYRNLNGPQLTTSNRFSVALTYNFASKKTIELEPGL